MGRPSSYGPEVAEQICARIGRGESLEAICRDEGFPDSSTVRAWLRVHEDFLANYTRAREDQADWFADEIVKIADTEEDVNRARVRIDARKWRAGRQKPKHWGDKVTLDGNVASTVTLDPSGLSGAFSFLARHGGAAEGGSDPAAG